jgi:hypothetical protein
MFLGINLDILFSFASNLFKWIMNYKFKYNFHTIASIRARNPFFYINSYWLNSHSHVHTMFKPTYMWLSFTSVLLQFDGHSLSADPLQGF